MTPCILHVGPCDDDGYGRVWFLGRSTGVHRVEWMRAHGPIPEGMDVLHRCDNRPCRNVEHLFLGTKGDNNRDRAAKGRSACGSLNGRAKLTPEMVRVIAASLTAGASMLSLAAEYGVDWTTIQAIRDGKTWRSVTGGRVPYPSRRSCFKRT